MIKKKKKVIIIAGATASGKSDYALNLAKKINGEIISSDSRQIYKKLEIFSGLNEKEKGNYLVAILNPEISFSAGDFSRLAWKKIKEINSRKKPTIVVGGTSFYFDALIYENFLPEVERNEELREELESKSTEELLEILKKLDQNRFEKIDKKNRPRIIRSIEIAQKMGSVPEVEKKIRDDLDLEIIWIKVDREKQKQKIEENFKNRIQKGFFEEAEELKSYFTALSWDDNKIKERFNKLGLSYKFIFKYWEGDIDMEEFIRLGILEEQKYAKRQNTYLKKFISEFPNKKAIKIIKKN